MPVLLLHFFSGTTFERTSLSAQNTYRFNGTMKLQVPMTSPMRLEFTVNTDKFVCVTFSPSGPGNREALYKMGKYEIKVVTLYKAKLF